ncbi:MAG: rod shape-determining protein MreD [Coriobacteriales bacterium]|jgi:rod shape-determining protein MreD
MQVSTYGRNSSAPVLGGNNSGPSTKSIVISVIVAFLLQAMLSPNIAIGGISPNFMLLILIPISCAISQRASTVLGFFLGLLFDLLGSGPVGAMALVLTVTGFALGGMFKTLKIDGFVLWLIVMAVTVLLANFAFCIVVSISGYETDFLASLGLKMLPWTLYDIIVGAIEWPFIRKMVGANRGTSLDSGIML